VHEHDAGLLGQPEQDVGALEFFLGRVANLGP
jgi:hypothetical protein